MMKIAFGALFCLASSSALAQQTDKIISGYGYAVDGNTIQIGSDKIRLLGAYAPLLDQNGTDAIARNYPAGLYARDVLASIIADQPLGCRVVPQNASEQDKLGRFFGICASGIAADVSGEMIKRGWSMIDRSGDTQVYSTYVDLESAAKLISKGIWQGPLEKPWEVKRPSLGSPKLPEN
jgi:endonuclease YncB( thermonuclease family)